ncbi:hypothetical protein [Amycolatopsis sp. NPDC051071]|uniref:hypothetical protein n=1 Tax=Amycolatopsis sp. NPDC051071 TaxID=3154637 RepID=UPI0034462CFF
MGASYWSDRGRFDGDPERALTALKARVFAENDYLWQDDETEPPDTLEELQETETFLEGGTHSVLDVHHFVGATGEDDFGTIRPLTDAELSAAFGTEEPSVAAFDELAKENRLPYESLPRWSARCALLYDGDIAVELAIWGISGD